MLHKKSSGVGKNKLMLHEKLFYVKQKKVDIARKSVSCRQKQDDAAKKNYFVFKKVITFSGTARHTSYFSSLATVIYFPSVCLYETNFAYEGGHSIAHSIFKTCVQRRKDQMMNQIESNRIK